MKICVRSLVWIAVALLGATCAIAPLRAQEEKDQPHSPSLSRKREAQKQRKRPSPAPPSLSRAEPARPITDTPPRARTETSKQGEDTSAAPSTKEQPGEGAPEGKAAAGGSEEELSLWTSIMLKSNTSSN